MTTLVIAVIVLAVFLLVMLITLAKFYRKVEQGHAMIVNTLRAEPEVTFTGRMVIPVVHKCEIMDISLKTLEIERTGKEGLICRDNIRADIKVKFFVRVNKTTEDVLKVAQSIGCARASNQETLENLFSAKVSEALKTVGRNMDFVDLYQARDTFRDSILRQIGNDLSGYVLEDATIDFLEQTPLEKLDPANILDAQGIKKITELTAEENVHTNELRRNEEMRIKKKDVETAEAMFELERQRATAEAVQQREIGISRSREDAEAAKVAAEERAKSELAGLHADQAIAVQRENSQREQEVAEKNRQRAVAIEDEKVTRARELEIVDRQREVALKEIEKEKALEIERKAIADVIRERIVVDRTVAEQEEAIKDLRRVMEAEREKKAAVVAAEGAAEEVYLSEVKKAQAGEQRAKYLAAEELTLAEARLSVAAKTAEGKKREAEGVEATQAAPGLAAARVALAKADADEKAGLVAVKVKQAESEAIAKVGEAEATALRLRLEAEATGRLKSGEAEAQTIAARYEAEAKGLKEKFEAMRSMDEETRAHEELRLKLDHAHAEALKSIDANQAIAREQAVVLSEAIKQAKIELVGGDGEYFERFMRSLSIGKAVDGTIGKSTLLTKATEAHRDGSRNLIDDIGSIAGALGGSSAGLRDLSVAALAQQLLASGRSEDLSALKSILEQAAAKPGKPG